MKICICRPPLARSLVVILAAVLALAPVAWGAGTVTNATQADLQAALDGGGTVTFGVGGVITLTNSIIITQDTVLNANGFAVTISGGNAVRLFQVNSNVAFSVNGLTLADGSVVAATGADGTPTPPQVGQDGFGGGILNLGGTVALTGCALTNHSAQGGRSGKDYSDPTPLYVAGGNGYGAALCNLGGTLSLTNCLLAGNSASGGTSTPPVLVSFATDGPQGGPGWGGAIYSANGRVRLQGVTFQTNIASGGLLVLSAMDNGVLAGAGFGGAIYATNSEVLLSGSVLEGNSAKGTGGPGLGGALFLDQGSSGVIRLGRFLGNSANGAQGADSRNTAGGDALGGAIFSGAELQVWDSTFSSNRCAGGSANEEAAGVLAAGAARGGAICSSNGLALNGSTFDGNLAQAGNIAVQLEAAGPGVAAEGGAVWSSGGVAATNSTWASNQAAGGASDGISVERLGPGGPGSGGAVCITAGQAVFASVTIADNGANGSSGSPSGASEGGGLYNTNGAVTVLDSIIANNLSGGDVWGAVTDGGYDICSDGTAGFSATGSLSNTDPLLGPLAANGGPTETMALLPGSPALDAVPSGFPPVDQRGVSRPQGPLADIGAFELAAAQRPVIVSQPQGASASTGTNVTFTVLATAAAPLAYQWFDNGAAIVGATNSSLSLTNIQPASAGAYWVVLTSAGVKTNSQTAFLIVDSLPLIVSWPTNVVVSVAGNGSFTVLAEGPSLDYQWWHNDLLVPGATNATLVIEGAQAGAQGTYQVAVSNFAGSAVSPDFQLSFDASGLAILARPPPTLTASVCDVLTLSVTATGVAPIAYQWQSDGTNVPGATNSALTLALPPMTGTNAYSVRVTNDYGDLTVSLALEVYYNYTWTTLAGSPGSPGAADGTGSVAQFRSPWGVAVDADGNVYVADYDNDTIRQITPAGVVSTLAGSPRVWGSADGRGGAALFGDPTGVAVDGAGNVYVADSGNDTIREITPGGVVTTLAGSAGQAGAQDGAGSTARFSYPCGPALDSIGNLYVADCGNDTIRRITPAAVVSTLAGNPEAFGNADGTGTAALFDGPQGLGVDAVGHVYVADDVNDTIRKVTPAGVVSTFAGSPGLAGIADGMGSAARFCGNGLQGVAVDGVGNVYVADTRNHTIRKITPAGLVTTLAGSPGQPGTGIGANGAVRFNSPAGVTVDARGVVYVGDTGNERIVKGMPPAPSNLVAGSYALATLAGQTNTLAVASLLQTWTAPQGDLLAISAVSPTSSQGGVVQLAGSTLTYTPATGFVGTDSFTYTVFDSRGASTQGTVTVTVIAATIDPTLAISLLPFNSVALRFAGVPGIAYHVEASTDLVHWAEIGTATAVTNGWFEFIDPAANLSTARFYRTRVP